MISYRQADMLTRIGKKPMIFVLNDRRGLKKFYNTISGEAIDERGDSVIMPVDRNIFERGGYIIVLDRALFKEHFLGSPVYRTSELVGEIAGFEHGGYLKVNNLATDPDEGESYQIDPLEYVISLSPDQQKVGLKFEPVS